MLLRVHLVVFLIYLHHQIKVSRMKWRENKRKRFYIITIVVRAYVILCVGDACKFIKLKKNCE